MPVQSTVPSARSPGRSRRRAPASASALPSAATQQSSRNNSNNSKSPQSSPRMRGTSPNAFAAYAHASPEPSAIPLPPLNWLVAAQA